MIVYGIKNCDKVCAALKQLKADGVEHSLHDVRQDGIDLSLVNAMLADIDLGHLINKRSTTWKQLSDAQKADLKADLIVDYPTLMKRPVIFESGTYRIGL